MAVPNDQERRCLGGRIRMRRQEKFGSKSEAYRAAGVNPATWDRLEAGEPVREDRMIAAVKALWPESGGNWLSIGQPVDATPVFGGSYDDPGYLQRIEGWLQEVDERLRALEAQFAEKEGESSEDRPSDAQKIDDDPVRVTSPASLTPAARHARSRGKQLQDEADALGEESQDPEGEGR